MDKGEQVLAFPRDVMDALGTFQGLKSDCGPYIDAIFKPGVLRFVDRERAENDETLKQLIPYVLIVSSGKVLFYVRGRKSGDKRLRLKGSIGIGGHINPKDETLFMRPENALREIYDAAVQREVEEEVVLAPILSRQTVGAINDDADAVGRVHFGIVHVWTCESARVKKAEKPITRLEFVRMDEILGGKAVEIESWSRYCLDDAGVLKAIARSKGG